ncbi:hypothetical protein IWW47_004489, partial [Coemansia sp. RSA 2052]
MDLTDNIHVVVFTGPNFEMTWGEFDIVVSGNLTVDILLAKVIEGMEVDVRPSHMVDLVTKRAGYSGWDELTNEDVKGPEWWTSSWDENLQ